MDVTKNVLLTIDTRSYVGGVFAKLVEIVLASRPRIFPLSEVSYKSLKICTRRLKVIFKNLRSRYSSQANPVFLVFSCYLAYFFLRPAFTRAASSSPSVMGRILE